MFETDMVLFTAMILTKTYLSIRQRLSRIIPRSFSALSAMARKSSLTLSKDRKETKPPMLPDLKAPQLKDRSMRQTEDDTDGHEDAIDPTKTLLNRLEKKLTGKKLTSPPEIKKRNRTKRLEENHVNQELVLKTRERKNQLKTNPLRKPETATRHQKRDEDLDDNGDYESQEVNPQMKAKFERVKKSTKLHHAEHVAVNEEVLQPSAVTKDATLVVNHVEVIAVIAEAVAVEVEVAVDTVEAVVVDIAAVVVAIVVAVVDPVDQKILAIKTNKAFLMIDV